MIWNKSMESNILRKCNVYWYFLMEPHEFISIQSQITWITS